MTRLAHALLSVIVASGALAQGTADSPGAIVDAFISLKAPLRPSRNLTLRRPSHVGGGYRTSTTNFAFHEAWQPLPVEPGASFPLVLPCLSGGARL